MKKFSRTVREKLGYYVYLLVDPRDGKPFYIGKGKGNRVFAHLHKRGRSETVKRIRELRKKRLVPVLEILKSGLAEDVAFELEAASMDILEGLTNAVRGHGGKSTGRRRVEELAITLDAKPARFRERAVLVNIARRFRDGMSPQELYDGTRSAWKVGKRRKKLPFAMAVYQGIIREVYEIADWFPGGSTLRCTDTDGRPKLNRRRWEFVGKVADENIRRRYLGRSVAHLFAHGKQNPIRYVDPDRSATATPPAAVKATARARGRAVRRG